MTAIQSPRLFPGVRGRDLEITWPRIRKRCFRLAEIQVRHGTRVRSVGEILWLREV